MSANTRARAYCFTINCTCIEEAEATQNNFLNYTPAIYKIAGVETAPTTGTIHIQGYMRFRHPKTFSAIKADWPTAHIEAAKGNFESNFEYCTKEGLWRESGDRPELRPQMQGWCDYLHSINPRNPHLLMELWELMQDIESELQTMFPESIPHDMSDEEDILDELSPMMKKTKI